MRFTPGAEGVAYRPRELILLTGDGEQVERARGIMASRERQDSESLRFSDGVRANEGAVIVRAFGVEDPEVVVELLRSSGIPAQLNHVLFAHCDGGCCEPHPAAAGGVAGSPVYATPVYATPVYATPVYATPVYATPVYATPVYATGAEKATGVRRTSARCVSEADAKAVRDVLQGAAATKAAAEADVVIIDTGKPSPDHDSGVLGVPNGLSTGADVPDADGNDRVDPCASHGRFIEGIVRRIAPRARVAVIRAIHPEGDGDEGDIAEIISALPAPPARGGVLNLSFGGYVPDTTDGLALAAAIAGARSRGWTVVASAGNDATCRRTYPAALPGVISVGAIGPHGPAPFTNYGPWVRACAPGVDLVSTFLDRFDADTEMGELTGWARWSGTSFSAPVVAGVLIQEALSRDISVTDAVARVIDAEGLLRLHNLGTVVNRL
ncbi:hypothetical protein GCM10023175_20370 [Pseudonocardia xishanensis]|uniref:Peptidase S8/S53 domain-containing protein n=1 Tax=Pseudonocardia xishanensis TaxID=630995 RepID=A0ABP8RNC0_9PSEU